MRPEREAEIRALLSLSGQIGDADCAWLVAIARDLLAALDAARADAETLAEALRFIAAMPTTERNPDGEEQAAHSMQCIAREALRERDTRRA